LKPPGYVSDLSFIRRTEAEGGNHRLSVEEIGAAGIRDQGTGNSGLKCFRLAAKQGTKVFGLEADFGAGWVFEIFRQELRGQFLTIEKRTEVGVTSLRRDLPRAHPEVNADHGVEPEDGGENLFHGRNLAHFGDLSNEGNFGAPDGN
jgi:hypothetical protein